ncbi:uncharacterized protein LOC144567120 [Carex rostrata]
MSISLKDAVTLSLSPQGVEFSEGEDQLYWIWSTSACYSAKFLYDVMMSGGKTICEFRQTWNFKIPPTVRIFAYLLFRGKILTHDVMERRGFNCDMGSITCDDCSMETAMHLFFQCWFATALWNKMTTLLGHRIMWPGHTLRLTYLTSWRRRMTNIPREEWCVYFIAACWFLWKERNLKLFEGKIRDPGWVAERYRKEGYDSNTARV